MRKFFFYIVGAHLFLFLNYSGYLNEVVRTNFFTNFWSFQNFIPEFREIVAPPGGRNGNYVLHLKERVLVKKLKTALVMLP